MFSALTGQGKVEVRSSVRVNGASLAQVAGSGLDIRKLASFVPARTHFEGDLSVEETLSFAATVAPGAAHLHRNLRALGGVGSAKVHPEVTTDPAAKRAGSPVATPLPAPQPAADVEAPLGKLEEWLLPLPPSLHDAVRRFWTHVTRQMSQHNFDLLQVVAQRVGLQPLLRTRVRHLSEGQMRLLAAGEAILSGARLLALEGTLDELPADEQTALTQRLAQWSEDASGCSVLSAAVPPSDAVLPHVRHLVLLGPEGSLLFAGPPADLAPYLQGHLGYPLQRRAVPLLVLAHALAENPAAAALQRAFDSSGSSSSGDDAALTSAGATDASASKGAALPDYTHAQLASKWEEWARQTNGATAVSVPPSADAALSACSAGAGSPTTATAAADGSPKSVAAAAAATAAPLDSGLEVASADWLQRREVKQRYGPQLAVPFLTLFTALVKRRVKVTLRKPAWWLPKTALALVSCGEKRTRQRLCVHACRGGRQRVNDEFLLNLPAALRSTVCCLCALPSPSPAPLPLPSPLLSPQAFGLFMGSLYFQPAISNFAPKASLATYICAIICAGVAMQMRPLIHSAKVAHSMMDRGWFGPLTAIASAAAVMLPLSAVSAALFTATMYPMVGYTTADGPGRAFFFLLVIFLIDVAATALFSAIAVATLKPDSIKGLTGLFILFYLYCGACVRRDLPRAAVCDAESACQPCGDRAPRAGGPRLRCCLDVADGASIPLRGRQTQHHVPSFVALAPHPAPLVQPASCCCPTRCRLPCTPSTGPTPSASACAQ